MKRQLNQEIINRLLRTTDYITAEVLASELSVSRVTITRRIAEINLHYESPIILSERGRGYKIDYKSFLNYNPDFEDSSSEERCNEVIKELLLIAPHRVRIYEIYDKFFVSESVIKNDKVQISKKLDKWDLRYIRSSRHLSIEGDERNIRTAIMEMVLNLSQTTDINALEEYCQGIQNNEDFRFAIKQIEYASIVMGNPILYPYNVSLFAHVYVLLGRIRTYRYVNGRSRIPSLLKEEKLMYPEVYSVCQQIIERIGSYLGICPDEGEVNYLFGYLSSARIQNNIQQNSQLIVTTQISKSYIKHVSNILQQPFGDSILDELEKHIHYMLQRLRNHILLPNALLTDIRIEYSSIFDAVRVASARISTEYSLPKISDDEVGFISLYFAKYLELDKEKINAYIVCTTGIGTSELIATKLKQTFPMINISGVTASTNISKIIDRMDKKIDLLISTVPIEDIQEPPVAIVSAILTNRDIVVIDKLVEDILNGK